MDTKACTVPARRASPDQERRGQQSRRRRQPVTQAIAVTVKGESISCSINNKVVATHPRSEVVAAGKLKSTDGQYGLRFGHNTDAIVMEFKKSKAQ